MPISCLMVRGAKIGARTFCVAIGVVAASFAADCVAGPENMGPIEIEKEIPIISVREDPRYVENYRAFRGSTNEVYNGAATGPMSHQEVVALRSGDSLKCTGTLIGPRIVLTAAHCLGGLTAVVIGEHANAPRETVRISELAAMPAIGEDRPIDVALALLARPPRTIKPFPLAAASWIDAARAVRIVGFGLTEKETLGDRLWANVVIATPKCDGSLPSGVSDADQYECRTGLELAAAPLSREEADTCNGDSGGPAFVSAPGNAAPEKAFNDALDAKHYAVAAITSRAISEKVMTKRDGRPNRRRCGDGGIYVRVDGVVLNWLQVQATAWKETIAAPN